MELLTKHQQQHAITTTDCTVHVSNIPEGMTEDNLIQFLAFPGNIVDYKKTTIVLNGEKKEMYVVVYSNIKETNGALKLNGAEILGQEIVITTPGKLSKVKRFDQKTKKLKEEKKKKKEMEKEQVEIDKENEERKKKEKEKEKEPKKPYLSEREKSIRRTIYLGNVNSDLSIMEIVDFFSCCGPISYVRLAGDGKQPTRFAFVEFFHEDSAKEALKMNGQRLANRPIKINESNNAIVKAHVRLTEREYSKLNRAIKEIKHKVNKEINGDEKKEKEKSPRRDRYDDYERDRRRRRGYDRYDYERERRRSYERRREYDYRRDYDDRRRGYDRRRDYDRREYEYSRRRRRESRSPISDRRSVSPYYDRKRRKYE